MSIGWYVHHHGAGHRARMQATTRHLDGVTVLSSLAPDDRGLPWVRLADDSDSAIEDATAHDTLHWAPRRHAGLRERMAKIARYVADEQPSLMVVDVSVEVATFVRLLGVPTLVVGQRGRRDDPPHRLAFAQADAIAVPWTTATHQPGEGLPDRRLSFVGALGRFDDVTFPEVAPGGDVLVLLGGGGHAITGADVAAAAALTPGRTWHVAGPLAAAGENVVAHGRGGDVAALLTRCSVVVGSAGGNVVAEVAAARRAFVCVPQARPFGEQHRTADALAGLGVAEVVRSWPRPAQWPLILSAAEARPLARWGELHDGHGARRLATLIGEAAAR